MRFFISAGEPSGDLHGSNLVRALARLDPTIRCDGFGGPLMRAAGCRLVYPLAEHAVMGFVRILAVVPKMMDLLDRVTAHWQRHRPDAVVLIDYPGFHWWLAERAKAMGLRVVSFVPPQIWAWNTGRVRKMQAYFDEVLCALPFEETWYHERGVFHAAYVGHPYFDALSAQRIDEGYVARQRQGGPVVGLLPGSRGQEVRQNWPSLAATAKIIHQRRPDAHFLVACFREEHRRYIAARTDPRLPMQLEVGKTPDVIEAATACVAVSGSVGLELLYRLKPSVVIYRTSAVYVGLMPRISKVPYISLVNLLAGKPLFPEYLTSRVLSHEPAEHVLRWFDGASEMRRELLQLREKVARPGACDRAATRLVSAATSAQKAS